MKVGHTQLDAHLPIGSHEPDISFVLAHLRQEDQYEFAAVGGSIEQAGAMIPRLIQLGDAWVHWDRETLEPVFMWGVAEAVPGVYQLWGFGTHRTRRAMPQITRWGLGEWLPSLPQRRPGIRRIEVRVPVSSVHSINWLQKLGMEIETRLPRYGVWGEDFFQLAMTFQKEVSENVPSPAVVRWKQRPADCSIGADENQR